MRTRVNPGRRLELWASLELVPPTPGFDGARRTIVIDRESGRPVRLADLLESFRADPSDTVIGPVVVTIEPASWAR